MGIVVNKMLINYEVTGEGNPVIIMHGWGQNLDIMYSVVKSLGNDYKVYNIDLPGFGESDEPNYEFTIDDYVSFLNEFININKIKKPIIIGHSFGCRIAIKYAAKSDNVKALILTGAAGLKPKRNARYYVSVYTYKFFKQFKDFPFLKHYIREMMENSGSVDYRNSSPIMKKVLINAVNEDLVDSVAQIKVPTLLVFGANDTATPVWMGEKMNSLIDGSKLVVYDNAGHYAYLERADLFEKDILKFLKDDIQ